MRKALSHLKKCDPVLGAIIDASGPFRMQVVSPIFEPGRVDHLPAIHGRAAATIFERFEHWRAIRSRQKGILKLSDAQLRGVGLSKQKSSYLKDLAAKTASGALDFSRLPELSDQEVIDHLTQVKGIGVWTAHMFLMFSLGRPNVLPTGDYGVQVALKKHYRKRKLPKPKDMAKIARAWEPYRSVACWYMWRSLDIKTP